MAGLRGKSDREQSYSQVTRQVIHSDARQAGYTEGDTGTAPIPGERYLLGGGQAVDSAV